MRLREWNEKLKDPMRILDVKRKVRSAFQGSKKGPAAAYIRMLSSMAFAYRPLESAKPREERKYSHMNEWAEDVLKYLADNHGTIMGSQRQLSEEIDVPYSSFKIVLQQLQEARKIAIDVQGKGRGAKTTITLVEAMQNLEVTSKQDQQQSQHTYEVPDANFLF